MKTFALFIFLLCLSAHAQANLCDSVKDGATKPGSARDAKFHNHLFDDKAYWGNRTWNEIIVECNRAEHFIATGRNGLHSGRE